MINIIDANRKAIEPSFLYYLHEENQFHKKSFQDLCDYIQGIDKVTEEELKILYWIQNQFFRHLIYHFDEADLSELQNLPKNYWEYVELLETAISSVSLEVDGTEPEMVRSILERDM